jgi:hypothetical protein
VIDYSDAQEIMHQEMESAAAAASECTNKILAIGAGQ